MRVSRRKFGLDSDEAVDIVNLKIPLEMFGFFDCTFLTVSSRRNMISPFANQYTYILYQLKRDQSSNTQTISAGEPRFFYNRGFFGRSMTSRIPSGKEIPRPTDVCRFVLRISGLRTLIPDGECHSLFSQ